uniref:Protein kinase domain-containing protein n=1 Tax=Oryzias latipes TaxID=8090 RepID=A0A3B3HCT4_ORYLA
MSGPLVLFIANSCFSLPQDFMTRESPESDASMCSRYIPESPEGTNLVIAFSHATNPKLAKIFSHATNPKLTKLFSHATNPELISKLDAHKYSLVKFVEWFHYNSHVCIVFEMLDQSLFDFMKDRSSHPLFLHEIRAIAWQLLISLKGLKSINLVHCDIKLDNIILVNQVSEPFRVKLIDFGLASKTTDIQTGTRLQNICFRAPEVILGLPLDERLDMWTVGYILALLYTGFYILPRDSEFNIIRAMVEMHGMPDNECLNKGLYTNKFFTKTEENSKIKEVEQLIDLLKRMLEVDPNKRISPNDALRHPFFNLEKKTPKTSKPQEPGPAANPQERSSNKKKKSLPRTSTEFSSQPRILQSTTTSRATAILNPRRGIAWDYSASPTTY